jgi:hypothetical protein
MLDRMNRPVWCCCSAGRSNLLVSKTLRTLARGNFTGSLYLIVPSEQVADYQRAVAGNPIHCVILHTEKGLVKQRKFFRDMMPGRTPIMWCDDDLEAIKIKTHDGLHHCENLDGLAELMYGTIVAAQGCLLGGVYPLCNRSWMKPTVSQNNAYCAGALYMTINDERLRECDTDECEDYYRQLSEQAAGRPVLRFNFVGIQTQYWKNPGGLQDNRSESHRAEVVERLCSEFSSIVRKRFRRDGKPDFKFLERATTWSAPSAPSPSNDLSTVLESPHEEHEQSSPSDSQPE